jgi:hypothetical protein
MVLLATAHTLKNDKGMRKREKVVKIGVPYPIYVPRTESRRVDGLLGLLHRWNRSCVLFSV